MPVKAGTRFDRYEITAPLGAGAMGEVYLARDTRLGRKVALKLLPQAYTHDADRVRRFEQEARAVSALNHPNIVTIYEVGLADGAHFIATEYVEGQTLRRRLQQGSLPLNEAVEIAAQIASALAAAHSAGIIHRDIKPENVMLRPDGYVKVLDFGLAKLMERPAAAQLEQEFETDPGVVMGTAPYMSPEQARAQKTDARSDIFSLGAVLYEMVAGRSPFYERTAADALAAVLHRDPAPLDCYGEVPAALAAIARQALAKNPDERYQTATALLTALRALRHSLPTHASAPLTPLATTQAARPTSASEDLVSLSNRDTLVELSARQTQMVSVNYSAGVIFAEIKKHQRSVLAAALILLALLAGAGYGVYRRLGARDDALTNRPARFTRLALPEPVVDAVLSPDGKYVAYVAEEGEQRSLRLKQIGTNNQPLVLVPATGLRFRAPTFSRDGNYIYYVLRGASAVVGELYRVPTLGGMARRLKQGVSSPVAVSPDDRQLAFVRELPEPAPATSVLLLVNADGTDERELSRRRFPDAFAIEGAAFSPDGQTLACPVTNFAAGINHRVLLLRPSDGRVRTLTEQAWPNLGRLTWTADGRGLLVAAREPRDLTRQVWWISYPSGQTRRLTNDLSDYRGVTLTANDATAAVVRINQISNLWTAPASNTAQARQITFGSGGSDGVQGLAWLPGGRLVYASNASGQPDLWQTGMDGNQPQPLTMDAGNDSFPSVAGDGRYIVFNSDRGGATSVWRIDADGGNLRQLTFGQLDLDPRSVPGSDQVIFSSIKSGQRSLWRVPLDGGAPTQLLEHLSEYPLISPDGRWIACAYRDEQSGSSNRIAILPSAGGAPVKTFPMLFTPWRLARWAPDGQALTYIKTSNGVSNIWSQPLAAGAAERQLTSFASGRIFAFDWSPDGKQLACARGFETREIVLISNFR